ncbi:MAG: transglutaminase domain-containing protein [Alistipes sp.]|nr:transglutaminase domain-containing protein [Alistipes sp.]
MENRYRFEICANSVESCMAAEEAGADRAELCASMPEGGTTPSFGEIMQARRVLRKTRLHVIIRPRGGDFTYSELESERMAADIEAARKLGADGVVFGCLTPEGDIDKPLCRHLLSAAEGLSATFHRAFDCCRNPEQALEDIIELGFDSLLTSGQQLTAEEGIPLLRQLHHQARGRIAIMAGSGVTAENILRISRETGIGEFHFSARENAARSTAAATSLAGSFGSHSVTTSKKITEIMKRLLIAIIAVMPMFAAGCGGTESAFIPDRATRRAVETAYSEKRALVGEEFMRDIDLLEEGREAEALRFLYAYMPLADITDYPVEFHLRNVRSSFRAQEEMPWGGEIPSLLFRHFVLPVRVNNEPLDDSRSVFYEELKERVAGLGMKEAILEVNHWCHEHVTYTPSDGRTLAPLACMKNALGRCGEESTFTVAALRSVGIPARQVYTPRWAHTDDNHAWVEAWADGEWYFLGACEPEAVLNLGWFNAPASRAMLMHTRAFGDYRGPEEVMLRTSCFTEINLIDNYGSSDRIDFRVVDSDGRPVEDARVDFKIYNYAEFNTVASKYTDRRGRTFLTAGKGDMLVWASKDGRFGYERASFGKERTVTITISEPVDDDLRTLDIVPPAERVLIPEVPAELQAENQRRSAHEDSLRRAYEATFYHPDGGRPAAEEALLVKSRGNWRTIRDFADKYRQTQPQRAMNLLMSLSDKDLRDMPMEILEDNMTARSSQLCPRVENEMIILPYKHLLQEAFDAETRERMCAEPSLLVTWVKENIRLNPDTKALRIAQTPSGVWRSRITDTRSRDIFFVSLARSLGIESRKDGVTGKVQYRSGDSWVDVDFEAAEQSSAPRGSVVLTWEPDGHTDNPQYYSHFTLSRIDDDGTTSLLSFDEGQSDMGGGTDWASLFRDGAALDAGRYLLTSGTRLANGSVLAANRIFTVREGETATVPLILRSNDTEVSVIGTFDSESRFTAIGEEGPEPLQSSILSHTGRGYFVAGIVGVGQEPTDHALRDIAKVREDFDTWGRPLVLLFGSEAEARKWRASDYGTLPEKIILGIDADGTIRDAIAAEMKLQNRGSLPVFIIADTFNRVVFCSEGYTIGLGEQLQRIIRKLEE